MGFYYARKSSKQSFSLQSLLANSPRIRVLKQCFRLLFVRRCFLISCAMSEKSYLSFTDSLKNTEKASTVYCCTFSSKPYLLSDTYWSGSLQIPLWLISSRKRCFSKASLWMLSVTKAATPPQITPEKTAVTKITLM